jgi:hypothetical protein
VACIGRGGSSPLGRMKRPRYGGVLVGSTDKRPSRALRGWRRRRSHPPGQQLRARRWHREACVSAGPVPAGTRRQRRERFPADPSNHLTRSSIARRARIAPAVDSNSALLPAETSPGKTTACSSGDRSSTATPIPRRREKAESTSSPKRSTPSRPNSSVEARASHSSQPCLAATANEISLSSAWRWRNRRVLPAVRLDVLVRSIGRRCRRCGVRAWWPSRRCLHRRPLRQRFPHCWSRSRWPAQPSCRSRNGRTSSATRSGLSMCE